MTRRLNRPFVALLGAALLAAALGGTALVWSNHRRATDPAFLQQQAKAAERSGDLRTAIELYQRAAAAGAGGDALYLRIADLAESASEQAPDAPTAVRYFAREQAALQQALTANPRNAALVERIIEDRYQLAQLEGSLSAWSALEAQITRSLPPTAPGGKEPGKEAEEDSQRLAKLYLYRGEARLRQAQQELPETRIAAIDADLRQAASHFPDLGKPIALQAQSLALQARRAVLRGLTPEARQLTARRAALLQGFLQTHPDDPDAVQALAALYLEKAGPAEMGQHLRDATALVEAAYARHPRNAPLGELLCRLWLHNDLPDGEGAEGAGGEGGGGSARVEQLLKDLAAADPAAGELRLARYYQSTAQTLPAISAYQRALARLTGGGGIAALQHENQRIQCLEALASLSLDQAEKAGVDTDPGRQRLSDALAWTSKLQPYPPLPPPPPGWSDLLEGRLQLLEYKLPAAAASLRRAQSGLTGPGQRSRLLQSRLLLARTYLLQQPPQPGAALQQLDEALTLDPKIPVVLLQRAAVLNQLRRFAEAQSAVEALLASNGRPLPPALAGDARRLLAAAKSGQGENAQAAEILTAAEDVPAMLQLAMTRLDEGETERALEIIGGALQKSPGEPVALQLSVIADLRLGRRAEALKTIDAALEKWPGRTSFEVLRAALSTGAAQGPELQRKIIAAITDEYVRQVQMAAFWHEQKQPDRELAALDAACASLGNADTVEARRRRADIIERLFNAAAAAATGAGDHAADYFDRAEIAVHLAERYDVDGVSGRLYRGRLEMLRTGGARGIDLLEQAVAQRPDYAPALAILGQAYVLQERFELAIPQFRQALRLIPTNVPLICTTLQLLVRKADAASLREAGELLRQGQSASPNDLRLAEFGDLLNPPEAAIRTRESIAAAHPADSANARRLLLLYLRVNQPDALRRATALGVRLVAEYPADLENVHLLAGIYAREQKIDEGERLLSPYLQEKDERTRAQALVILGEFYRGLGRVDQAIAAFQRSVTLQPGDVDGARRHLGDLYFDLGAMSEARKVYQEIVDRAAGAAESLPVLRRLAEAEIREGDPQAAQQLIEGRLLARDPKDREALVLRAYALIGLQRPQDAIAGLTALLAGNGEDADARYYRALAQSACNGDLRQAIDDLEMVQSIHRATPRSRALLVGLYRRVRRVEEAIAGYAALVRDYPRDEAVRREYADFLMMLARVERQLPAAATDDLSASVRRSRPRDLLQGLLESSRTAFPEDAAWPLLSAELCALRGDEGAALALRKALYQARPDDPRCAAALAESLLQSGDPEKAAALCSQVLETHPELLEVRLRRAAARAKLNRWPEAVEDVDRALTQAIPTLRAHGDGAGWMALFEQAARILPPDTLAARLRVRLRADPEDLLSAVALVHTLVALHKPLEAAGVAESIAVPAEERPLAALVLRTAGMAHLLVKKDQLAAAEFRGALAREPDDLEALNNLSFVLGENLHDPRAALPYAKRAVELLEMSEADLYSARAGDLYDTAGWIKSLAGEGDGALRDLHHSVECRPSAAAYLHLALAAQKAGPAHLGEARDAAARGLELAPGADPVRAALQELSEQLRAVPAAGTVRP